MPSWAHIGPHHLFWAFNFPQGDLWDCHLGALPYYFLIYSTQTASKPLAPYCRCCIITSSSSLNGFVSPLCPDNIFPPSTPPAPGFCTLCQTKNGSLVKWHYLCQAGWKEMEKGRTACVSGNAAGLSCGLSEDCKWGKTSASLRYNFLQQPLSLGSI